MSDIYILYIYIFFFSIPQYITSTLQSQGLDDFSRFPSGALGKSTNLSLSRSWKVNGKWHHTSRPLIIYRYPKKKSRSPDSPNIAPPKNHTTKIGLWQNLGSHSNNKHTLVFCPWTWLGFYACWWSFYDPPAHLFLVFDPAMRVITSSFQG